MLTFKAILLLTTAAVTVVNVQGGELWKEGATGIDSCPTGYSKINSAEDCIEAAKAIFSIDGDIQNYLEEYDELMPKGCYHYEMRGKLAVRFNTANIGAQAPYATSVCEGGKDQECASKLFKAYSDDAFQLKTGTKSEAKALIATIKKAYKAIKADYRAAKKNLKKGPVAPATPGPVAPATPGPVAPATPGPVAPATPGPVAPATPGPVAPATPGPVAPPATTGAPTCRNGADTNIAPNGTMVACDHPDDGVCEEDFETLCPTGWGLCTHAQWVERRQGWTVNGQLLGEIHCRSGAGAGHFKPVSNQLDGERNCAFGSSRPSCSATYGCNEKAMLALCCAPTPTCGNGAIDSPEELCDDGNQDESDACLNSCDFRAC